ncbi:MAG: PolC-type DNA polymerase III [Ruminococcus sp.]|jgi:DNA polymerase III alpha chain|nr:PolC-type DNA polymerase III [Ruminococcus sp.]
MNLSELLSPYVENIPPVFAAGDILTVSHTKNYSEMRITAAFKTLTDEALQRQFEETARTSLGLVVFEVIPRFNPSLWGEEAAGCAVAYLRRSLPAVNGHFANAVVTLSDGEVHFTIDKPTAFLELNSFCKNYSKIVAAMFGVEVKTTLTGGVPSVDLAKKREELVAEAKAEAESQAAQEAARVARDAERAERQAAYEALKEAAVQIDREELETIDFKTLPILQSGAKTLKGKKITGNELYQIKDINGEIANVIIWGDVFAVDVRDLKSRTTGETSTLVKIAVTDYTGSVYVKFFDDRTSPIADRFTEGMTLLLKGKVSLDKFDNDYVFTAANIMSVVKETVSDNADRKRVELHLHTNMSALDALTPASKLVRRAFEWGHKAIAITDHGVVQAFPEAASEAAAIRKEGGNIKILYGVEAYFVNDDDEPNLDELTSYHQIIIAKNAQGLKNLYRLVSYSNLKYFRRKPRIPKSVLNRWRDGLIIGAACEQGELFQALLAGKPLPELDKIASYYDYLEIQPIANNRFMLSSVISDKKSMHYGEREYPHINSEEDLKELNRRIVDIGKRLNIPVCATCDVHILDKKDIIFRTILTYGMFGQSDTPLYFRTTTEMLEEFAYLGDYAEKAVIDNPNFIADMVNPDVIPIPHGTFAPSIPGADESLIEITNACLKANYGENPPEIIAARFKREIDSIIKHRFSVLYMIAQKLVKYSNDNGYQVGSRGSVGSSFVAFLAGISEVNPLPPHYVCKNCFYTEFIAEDVIKRDNIGSGYDLPAKNCPHCNTALTREGHDIPFETFLGFDGDKSPDIDLNFSGVFQPEMHKYTETLFNKVVDGKLVRKVFKAGTIATVADKTAFGYVKHYLDEEHKTVTKAEVDRLTAGCTGVKRTTGQHSGGMVVVSDDFDVYDFTPIMHPADDDGKGVITTHFDFNSMHDTILKLDELGHAVPTLYKHIEGITGIPIEDVFSADEEVMSLYLSPDALGNGLNRQNAEARIYCKIGTLALPEMGTPFTRQIIETAKPTKFSDLVQISGLSHGIDVWLDNAVNLIQNGTCTISEVIGTRDSIMTYLMQHGVEPKLAFKIMEFTRKGNAKKFLTPEIKDNMLSHGVPQWYIDSCLKIAYMFPKAHAAAYVMSAMKLGWYKINRPLEFYATTFTVRSEFFDAESAQAGKTAVKTRIRELTEKTDPSQKEIKTLDMLYVINEFFERGFSFAPVDILKSDAEEYTLDNGKIRLPMSSVAGVSSVSGRKIAEFVKNNELTSVEDLAFRTGANKTVIEALTNAGAFGNLPATNQITFF